MDVDAIIKLIDSQKRFIITLLVLVIAAAVTVVDNITAEKASIWTQSATMVIAFYFGSRTTQQVKDEQ